MPLTKIEPPAELQEALADSADLLKPVVNPDILNLLIEGRSSSFFAGPIYNLGAADILQGVSLRRGRLTGWIYLIADVDERPVGLELTANEAGGVVSGSLQVFRGPMAESTAEAMLHLREVISDRSYTINFLRIPPLRFYAAWLRDESGEKDAFVPLRPSPPAITSGAAYIGGQLEVLLRASAQNLARQDPEGES